MSKKTTQTYSKLIKTSKLSHQTFTTDQFIVTDSNGVVDDDLKTIVIQELIELSDLMRKNENHFYQNNFRQLIKTLADGNSNTKGKKNAALRAYVDDIPFLPKTQPYNFKEMLRYNIASKTDVFITRFKTEMLLNDNPDASPRFIRNLYLSTYDDNAPSINEIKKYKQAIENSGRIDGDPHSNGQLPISATDGHYRQLTCDDTGIHLTIKLECGIVTLHFNYPKNKKRYSGKVCAPTIRCKDDRLLFDFAVQTTRPEKKKLDEVNGFIGVDAGEVNTVSYCYVSCDHEISQPFLETKRLRKLESQVKSLFSEIDALTTKALKCDENGFFDKAEVLYREASMRRKRISRLKKQTNELAACEIVRAAVVLDAGIAVEDLSWAPESHWDHADLQNRLSNLAADHGIPVVKVNAAGTSTTCPKCGAKMVNVGKRKKRCTSCGYEGDRDVIGERNVGIRANGFSEGSNFRYKLTGLGTRAHRRKCSELARCNKLCTSDDAHDDRVHSSMVFDKTCAQE